MAFPGSAWKYVPSSGVPTPPRCVPPWVRTGVGLWRGALVAPRHWLKSGSAGRAPAASGRSEGCLQRRTTEGPVGVLVASAPQQSLAASVHHLAHVHGNACASHFHRRSSDRRRSTHPRAARVELSPSNGARLPAELKHITKRRKRNQQGCP